MKISTDVKLTPKQVAEVLWGMGSDEQAEVLNCLYELSGGDYLLVMQSMAVRDECIRRGDNSLGAFQTLFASAFPYAYSYASNVLWGE